MPSMPAMPAMPSIPSIPGLRKNQSTADGELVGEEGAAVDDQQAGAATVAEEAQADDEDKSRYNAARYVGQTIESTRTYL